VVGCAAQGAGEQVVQAFGLGDGEWDQPGAFGWQVVGADRWRGEGVGAVVGVGGGGRADGEGGEDQDQVPVDGGVKAELGVVEPEMVLAELVVFLHGPAASGDGDQGGQGGGLAVGDVGVEVGQLGGFGEAAADE